MTLDPEAEAYFKTAQIFATIAGLFMIGASGYLALSWNMVELSTRTGAVQELEESVRSTMDTQSLLFAIALGFAMSALLAGYVAHNITRYGKQPGILLYIVYAVPLASGILRGLHII